MSIFTMPSAREEEVGGEPLTYGGVHDFSITNNMAEGVDITEFILESTILLVCL